jgi:hypothetical protein
VLACHSGSGTHRVTAYPRWSKRLAWRPETGTLPRYITPLRFETGWNEQCRATMTSRRRFGLRSALDYLIGEKLVSFAEAAEHHPEYFQELPRFLAAIWRYSTSSKSSATSPASALRRGPDFGGFFF